MGFSLYRNTRSARLIVTVPDGAQVVVENMRGNEGFRLAFDATRTMDENPGEFVVRAWNLPPDALAAINSAQVRSADDLDAMLVDATLGPTVAPDGASALAAGFAVVELEAGYDGQVSRIFRAIGARITTDPADGDTTFITSIIAAEDLDGQLLGFPHSTFLAGTPTIEVLTELRRCAGLGEGNATPATMAALLGDSRIDGPYHVSGGQAIERIRSLLQYLRLRWFVDDRELWLCGRDEVPTPGGMPPWIADEIGEPDLIKGRPGSLDGGKVRVECMLCPRLKVGRLVRLTEGGLALQLQGLSPNVAQIIRSKIKPGLYRLDAITHTGDTGRGPWSSVLTLRPTVGAAG
jgi:hypothetical protein